MHEITERDLLIARNSGIIIDTRQCPRCHANLLPPAEALGIRGEQDCHACKLPITWMQLMVALEGDDPYGKVQR